MSVAVLRAALRRGRGCARLAAADEIGAVSGRLSQRERRVTINSGNVLLVDATIGVTGMAAFSSVGEARRRCKVLWSLLSRCAARLAEGRGNTERRQSSGVVMGERAGGRGALAA